MASNNDIQMAVELEQALSTPETVDKNDLQRFTVSTSQPPQLVQIPDEKDTSEVDKVVVCLEDMFDCCSAIHNGTPSQ